MKKTQYKGVHRSKVGRWEASLSLRLKDKMIKKYLGTFGTPQEAYKRRCDYLDSLK